jgi:hypothetical protein
MLASFAILARFPVDYLKDFAEQYFFQTLKQLFEQLAERFSVDESNPYYSVYVSIVTQLNSARLTLMIVLSLVGAVGALLAARKLYDMLG